MMVQNLKKKSKSKFSNFFAFSRHSAELKQTNREAVVVCARHVVKRPSKRSALAYTIKTQLKYISALRLLGRFTTYLAGLA